MAHTYAPSPSPFCGENWAAHVRICLILSRLRTDMIALAHAVAVVSYLAAAGLAAIPFARPIRAPVRSVVWVLAAGIAIHAAALVQFVRIHDEPPLTGLGPALSFAALLVAI